MPRLLLCSGRMRATNLITPFKSTPIGTWPDPLPSTPKYSLLYQLTENTTRINPHYKKYPSSGQSSSNSTGLKAPPIFKTSSSSGHKSTSPPTSKKKMSANTFYLKANGKRCGLGKFSRGATVKGFGKRCCRQCLSGVRRLLRTIYWRKLLCWSVSIRMYF